MNSAQLQVSKNIMGGLSYLLLEAENNKLPRVTEILKICVRDVGIALEIDEHSHLTEATGCQTELFVAIKFLSRFASIKDDDLKKEILSEISKIKNFMAPPEAVNAS